MAQYKKVDITITGEVSNGYDNSRDDYRIMMAELEMIAAKYDLELKEKPYCEEFEM